MAHRVCPAKSLWAHLDTPTNDGGANLPVCPNLIASKRSDAGGTMGIYAHKNIAPLVLVEVWTARQRRPTWWYQDVPLSWGARIELAVLSRWNKMFRCRFDAARHSVGCLGSSIGRAVDS